MYGARQGGGAGPIVLVPGGLFWTRRRAGVDFRWVVPDTHDYFLPAVIEKWCRHDYFLRRPKAGHRKVSHSRGLGPAARWGGVPKVAPELLPWPVGVLVVAPMGWCFKTLSQNPRWGGVPKVGVMLQKFVPESSMGWCSKSWDGVPKSCPRMGWCSKKLSQNPHCSMGWCSKSCPRIPTLYTTGSF